MLNLRKIGIFPRRSQLKPPHFNLLRILNIIFCVDISVFQVDP